MRDNYHAVDELRLVILNDEYLYDIFRKIAESGTYPVSAAQQYWDIELGPRLDSATEAAYRIFPMSPSFPTWDEAAEMLTALFEDEIEEIREGEE